MANFSEKAVPSMEKRNPLEKVDWNFWIENPEEFKNFFNRESKKVSDGELFYPPREIEGLDGWLVKFSNDYLNASEEIKTKGALVLRRFHESVGKGAEIIIFPLIKDEGNCNPRKLIRENNTLQAELALKKINQKKGDMFEKVRVC